VALRRERDVLERRYRALVEVADVLVIGLDRNGKAALVNPKFTTLTGVSPSAASGIDLCEQWITRRSASLPRGARVGGLERGAARARGPPARLADRALAHAAEPPTRVIRWNLSAEGAGGWCSASAWT